ncbi:MAG: elongation factor 1-beta [Candidatus Aenigmatarchaeota archaeon]
MSRVIVTFKVMPTGTDVDIDKLEKEIKASINPERVNREPIAFGLVALNVTTLVEDAGGQVDSVETKLKAINGVSEVEVTEITRTL